MTTLTLDLVHAALRARYKVPEYALLFEVRNGTGYRRQERYADAVAMSLWPSRGLELHGIECKVSRSDWLKEKADPAKAESIQRFMDRWWVAVGDETIVQPGELPPTWGLLVPKGKRLVARVEAPKLEAEPVDRLFLASLLRSVTEQGLPKAQIAAEVEQRTEAWKKQEEARQDRELVRLRQAVKDLRAEVDTFERASGVRIASWNGRNVGEAVRILQELGDVTGDALERRLRQSRDNHAHVVAQIERLLSITRTDKLPTEREGSAA